jgi:subtilisin-like proprotein convertase family protein
MGTRRSYLLIVPMLLTFACTVSATTIITETGTGGTIPDAGVLSLSIMVGDSNTILSSGQNVTLDLTDLVHSWAGNLSITLEHVGYGGAVSGVTRVGSTNNGNARAGYSSDYNGTYSFNNNFTGDLWNAANIAGSTSTIPSGSYYPTSRRSARETAFSDVWNGQSITGEWRLTITDWVSSNTGTLGSWDLRFAVNDPPASRAPIETPEPATTALLVSGMAGLLFLGRSAARRNG